MQAIKELFKQLVGIWKELGLNQKITVSATTLAVIAGVITVLIWSGRTEYSLLYGNLDPVEAGKVTQSLDENNIEYKISGGGGSIYVPRGEVHQMRMKLATQGIPKGEGMGYELLDKNTLGMSDFMQHANYNRAVQGELARTISKFSGIESARVMIVSPENRLLIDPGRHATASVFLTMRGTGRPKVEAVSAIQMLVANSVEGLNVNHVSVVDNSGNVLSLHDEEDSLVAVTSGRLRARKELENYLGEKVESMLEKIVGNGNVVARVSAQIATDSTTIVSETYENDNPVQRQVENSTETSKEPVTSPGGPAGVTPNIATGGANTQIGVGATNEVAFTKTDSTIEYALSKTMSNRVVLPGNILDLNAAVFVNTNQAPVASELMPELSRAAVLALGPYDKYSNNVQVAAVSFDTTARNEMMLAVGSSTFWDRFWDVGKSFIYVALAAAGLFVMMRTFKRTSEEFIPTGMTVGEMMASGISPEGMTLPAGAVPVEGQVGTTPDDASTVPSDGEDVEMITEEKKKLVMDFGLGEEQPERVTVEVLKDLIAEKPDKMSQAARSWLLSGSESEESS
ncbi:MAG: flagellar basal-body MS-ring/collar protein FliF [Verrucomicrobiota bacterium]|nr:flagellar basal-body MS-ring/collar protein FliF [Verrucomicrobiota bacterium]